MIMFCCVHAEKKKSKEIELPAPLATEVLLAMEAAAQTTDPAVGPASEAGKAAVGGDGKAAKPAASRKRKSDKGENGTSAAVHVHLQLM